MTPMQKLGENGHFYECPRWHEGMWWISDFYAHHVVTVAESGKQEKVVTVPGQPGGLGWLPNGDLLVVSMKDRRILRRHGEELHLHADLSGVFPGFANDMIVNSRGYAYVGNFGFDFEDPTARTDRTVLAVVDPKGSVSVAAADLAFPNGAVITPDGRMLIVSETLAARHTSFAMARDGTLTDRHIWAQVTPEPSDPAAAFDDLAYAPDGCCIDAEGYVWSADALSNRVVRVNSGGTIEETVELPTGLSAYACGLGGSDGHTLIVCAAPDPVPAARKARAESVLMTVRVSTPRVGYQD